MAYVAKPNFTFLLGYGFDKFSTGIDNALKEDYPDFLQAVGTRISGWGVIQPITILPALIHEGYARFQTLALTDDQIEMLLEDVASFFDSKTVRYRVSAPALNLHGPPETPPITFPGGISLRAMNR